MFLFIFKIQNITTATKYHKCKEKIKKITLILYSSKVKSAKEGEKSHRTIYQGYYLAIIELCVEIKYIIGDKYLCNYESTKY